MKPRILIVEDEPGIADTLQYALRTDGFEPAWCATGEEALERIGAAAPALVILDVGLPDASGFEIFKRIRDATGGRHEIKEATLYATYRRLLKDGLIEAYWGDESQGGRRKYYRITDAGQAVYRDNVRAWVVTRGLIDSLLDLGQTSRPERQRS